MGEIADTVAKLSLASDSENPQDVEDSLTNVSKHLLGKGSDRKSCVELLVDCGIVDVFVSILKSREKYCGSIIISLAEMIAELAKTALRSGERVVFFTPSVELIDMLTKPGYVERGAVFVCILFLIMKSVGNKLAIIGIIDQDVGRQKCSDELLLESVLDLLASEDPNLVLQACRALGNICYDNDVARCLVKEKNGIERVINLLKTNLQKENLPENFHTVTSGCLMNLTDTYEEIQEQALEGGILEVLLQYLSKYSSDEDVVTHCLLVLSCFADSETSRSKLLEKSVLLSLLNLFERPLGEDVMDSLLEMFGNLCDNDSAKEKLAGMGLCDKLVYLVKKNLNGENTAMSDNPHIYKTVPELVILILTGDASMEFLFSEGEGLVYKETSLWLKSQNENLRIAGALAAGNFARKDSHCIRMLKDGIGKDLLLLLEQHSGKDGDIRMQHAVLSALRNLAIPANNKASLVELGIVDKLVKMMDVETFPVVFKLLGTLRMLLDKQEKVAVAVGHNVSFVSRLVEWCGTDDHPGVKGEATRILAWLAKNSKSSSVMKNLVECNAMPHIIAMLKSEHQLMQNEALIAITLVSKCCAERMEEICDQNDFCNAVSHVLTSNSSPEMAQNALTLFLVLLESGQDGMKSLMHNSGLPGVLRTLNYLDERGQDMRKKVLSQIEGDFSEK